MNAELLQMQEIFLEKKEKDFCDSMLHVPEIF